MQDQVQDQTPTTNEEAESSLVGSIQMFHFSNGTHVMAKIKGIDFENGQYLVARPLEVMAMPNQEKGKGPHVHFTPWLSMFGAMGALEEAVIDSADLFFPRTPSPKLEATYREITGDIQVPQKPSIIVP
jgi:hypothetical protein